jgi:hypothetical protein
MLVFALLGRHEALLSPERAAALRPRCRSCLHNYLSVDGLAHALRNDADAALRTAAELEELVRRSGARTYGGNPWVIRALALRARGATGADAAKAEALRIFEAGGNALGRRALERLWEVSTPHPTVGSRRADSVLATDR